jgi:hypothetical protein
MSPLNAAICTTTYLERQKCYRPGKKILFKTIIWPWGQSPTKVITVRDTPPYGHAPTYQISLTYLERQKCYGTDKKILFTKQLFDLEVNGQGPTKVITVRDTLPYGHSPTYQISLTYLERQKSYGPDKLRWEAEEKIRLKQYVSLRSNYSDLKYFDNLAECFCDSPLPSMFLVIRNIRYKMTANIEQSFNLGVYCRRIFSQLLENRLNLNSTWIIIGLLDSNHFSDRVMQEQSLVDFMWSSWSVSCSSHYLWNLMTAFFPQTDCHI